MSEKDTAVFSPMITSPDHNDEAQIETTSPSVVEAASVDAGETRPDDQTELTTEPANSNWEQRAKDAQRALAERDRGIQDLRVELEVMKRTMGANSQPVQDVKAEIEKLESEVRDDPANAVRYVHKLLAMRDDHYQRELYGLREELQRKELSNNPEYKAIQESLKLVQDIPEFQYLPVQVQAEVARRMRANTSQMRPPGSVGGKVVAGKKQVTPEERFGAFLRASGAIKSQAPRGVVPFRMGR
jgi:hypothetical protein